MKTGLLCLIPATIVAGCAGIGVPNYQDMTAKQIEASTKDKSSTIVCSKVPTPWGIAENLIANLDKTTGTGGGSFSMECGTAKAEYKDAGKAAPVVHPVPVVAPVAVPK